MPTLGTRTLFSQLDGDSLSCVLSVFSYLTLCRLRSACKNADDLIATEMRFRFRSIAIRFFEDPDDFRALLCSTSTVISGSVAVRMASGRDFSPQDLDLYTTAESAPRVVAFLEANGYVFLGYLNPCNSEYRGGIMRVVCFARGPRTVDLVISLTQSPTLPVVYFWSTLPMIFVGGNGLCIPYPSLLEHERGLLNPGRKFLDTDRLAELIDKYERRGFKIKQEERDFVNAGQPVPPCRGAGSATCPVNTRFLGDRFCLQSAFGRISQCQRSAAFTGTLAKFTNVWWRGGAGCRGECNEPGLVEFDTWTQRVEMVGL